MATRLRKPSPAEFRKIQPEIFPVSGLTLPTPTPVALSNGLTVHTLHFPQQEILKIDVAVYSGRAGEAKRVAARATARLQREGVNGMTGAQVAEWFDYYGASMSSQISLDMVTFSLVCLRKHAEVLIPTFAAVLLQPSFPQKELDIFVETNIRELQVELEKVDTVAYRKATELIFGENHPYGYNSVPDDFRALTVADLHAHFARWNGLGNARVFASGHIDDHLIGLLDRHLGAEPLPSPPDAQFDWRPAFQPGQGNRVNVPHEGSLQAAIKLARPLFHRRHPDYGGMAVLNTVLGGYFGSRLMSEIREKKGYTYNIYSSIDTMMHDGYFYISTEVNADKTEATLKAINLEMKRLRDEPVADDELDMVKNYLLGLMLTSLDGPLNTAEVVRSIMTEGLSVDHFAEQVRIISDISPETLMSLANQYLQPADFQIVVVK